MTGRSRGRPVRQSRKRTKAKEREFPGGRLTPEGLQGGILARKEEREKPSMRERVCFRSGLGGYPEEEMLKGGTALVSVAIF